MSDSGRGGDTVAGDAQPDSTTDASALILTVDEAADILRISRGLAFAAVRNGTIPHLRIGRRILIPRAALDALLKV